MSEILQTLFFPDTVYMYLRYLLKFPNFRYHCNTGCSGTNFTSTVKFADPDKPLLGAGMGVASPIQVELLQILCSNYGGWLTWQHGSVRGKFGGHH